MSSTAWGWPWRWRGRSARWTGCSEPRSAAAPGAEGGWRGCWPWRRPRPGRSVAVRGRGQAVAAGGRGGVRGVGGGRWGRRGTGGDRGRRGGCGGGRSAGRRPGRRRGRTGRRGPSTAARRRAAGRLHRGRARARSTPPRRSGRRSGGPVGEALARGAAEARLGGEPADAWGRLTALPGAGPLARLLERADRVRAPAAEPVARLASDARAESGRAATARARRAAVLITAPVGLCFLPAFLAVGVCPW